MDCTDKRRRRDCAIDVLVFVALLAAASFFTLRLFYKQVMGEVESDMLAYTLEIQGLESGYDFPYPIFFKLAALIHLFVGPGTSVIAATLLLNGFGMVVTKAAFNRLAPPRPEEGGFGPGKAEGSLPQRILMSLLSVSLFFISMLYLPEGIYLPGIRFRYMGVFTANPYHNATYLAARPFAILAFLWFVKLLPEYEKKGVRDAMGDYICFSIFLLVSTMTKPSFTLVMVSAAGLLMLYRLIRSGFRSFFPAARLGLCFLPTFLNLLYQYRGVFASEEGQEKGLGFCFGEVWASYCDNIPLGIGLAIGFPILVLLLNGGEWKRNAMLRFSWLLYLLSFAEAFLLYEKGFRKMHFNFSWGYMYGIFFCHFSSLLLLAQLTFREAPDGGAVCREDAAAGEGAVRRVMGRYRKFFLAVQWLAYLWHVVCGISYFGDLLLGRTYY